MGFLSSLDMGLKIDSSTGVLTDVSDAVNSASMQAAFSILEHVGLGDSETGSVQGVRQLVRLSLNGFINTTTDGIFGPILAAGTTITKTVEFQESSSRYYNGEWNFSNVQISGSSDTIQTWSAELANQGTINRTSVGL